MGQPFYESLSETVDRDVSPDGTAPQSGLPLHRELWISIRDSARILVRAMVWGVLLFALGFIPFVGQTVVPVIGFFVTGFFLTEELTAIALQRRGVELRERLALLRSRKLLVWGFGTPLGLAFLVPFVAVFLMPGAVAGATLLARDLLGEETAGEREPEGEQVTPPEAGSGEGVRRHRHDRPDLRDDVDPVPYELGVGDRPRRGIRVPRPELQDRCVDMPAGQGPVQSEPVPQQRRPVRDLVGEIVAAPPARAVEPGVGPSARTTAVVPPAGISVTSVWS